ncbi:MAG: MerC domain-containing protein [Terricaulis sp.]
MQREPDTLARARVWDTVGIVLSALCLAHCLALPIAAVVLPFFVPFAAAEWVHWAFAVAAAPVSFFAIAPHIKQLPPIVPGAALMGVALLVAGALMTEQIPGEGLTIAGGVALSLAHVMNWRRGHDHS